MDASPKWFGRTAPFIFIGIFLSLMLLVSSLPARWDVVYASHCGVGMGVGAGTGVLGTATATGTVVGTVTGTESGVALVVTVSASPSSLQEGGTTTITATVTTSGSPVSGASMAFVTTLGTISPASATTSSTGVATATLSSTTSGTATVDAKLLSNTGNPLACPETAVTFTAAPSGGGGGAAVPAPVTEAPPPGSQAPGAPGQPAATAPVSSATGGNVDAGGGAAVDGGVTVAVPPAAFQAAGDVSFGVSMIASAPPGVSPPGGTSFLPRTIEITARSLGRVAGTDARLAQASPDDVVLAEPLEIRVNLTAQELSGRNLSDVIGALVTEEGAVEPMPTQVVDLSQLVVSFSTHHLSKFTLFSAFRPGPTLTDPPHQAQLPTLGTTLRWTNPPGTTWFEVKVTPFNFDGPGIDLIIGDASLVAAAEYVVKQPDFGGADPSYVVLPGMTYAWHVRTASTLGEPSGPDWASWSNPRFFTTAVKTSATISRVAPDDDAIVEGLTPTLTWSNSDPAVFYYEVQASKDPGFGSAPGAPFLYWELRHGALTGNSYAIPSQFPLEAGTTYHWRVRPRIQGDGKPVDWSAPFRFNTP